MSNDDPIARLRELADKFSEGWHDGIRIDASDVMDLSKAADALTVQAREIEALRAAVLAEREACIERVKTCLYLDWEGRVLLSGPVLDANAEILRCVSAIRARKAVTP